MQFWLGGLLTKWQKQADWPQITQFPFSPSFLPRSLLAASTARSIPAHVLCPSENPLMRASTHCWFLVASLAALVLGGHAQELAKECGSNSDCSADAWCVAGDAQTSVQRCVAGTPCGGAISGSCPADPSTGQLACIWRPDAKACTSANSGCKEIGGEPGIYKCISLDRCDQYFGDGLCSGACVCVLIALVRLVYEKLVGLTIGSEWVIVAGGVTLDDRRLVQPEWRAVQWPRQLPGDVRERYADIQVRVRLGLERHQVRQRGRWCVRWLSCWSSRRPCEQFSHTVLAINRLVRAGDGSVRRPRQVRQERVLLRHWVLWQPVRDRPSEYVLRHVYSSTQEACECMSVECA